MNPFSIFSKTGKGPREAGGKTSRLSRADRLNANISLDTDASAGPGGRIADELKTPAQVQRAALTIAGKLQEPQIRK